MAKHLLQRHFGISGDAVHHYGPDVEAILRLPASDAEQQQ